MSREDFSGLFTVRDYKPEDKPFVISTFLRGLYYGEFFWCLIPKDIFFDNYKRFTENLLASPNVVVKVACLPDDEDVIIGYSILSADFSTIHWVYVKAGNKKLGLTWRNKGIATALVPKYPTAVTHLTKLGIEILAKKFTNVIFNPFKL